MSDENSDANTVVSSVSIEESVAQSSNVPALGDLSNVPALGDLSERDKPWDKHKQNSDRVAGHYARSEFDTYSQRTKSCADLLDFRLVPEASDGVYKLKLAAARFCRVRHCPICQWRRSLMWKAKAYQALPRVVQDWPKHRWLFLTLTLRNSLIEELRATLDHVNKSFVRLTKLKDWPGVGWIKSVEVTRGRDGLAHPHLHILLMVAPGYFGPNYLSQVKWAELWRKSLRIDYMPQTHVRAIAKDQDPTVIIPEILKYQCKASDLFQDRDFLLELTKQLHKTRAVAVGGVLRGYMRELEQDPEDLIGEDDQGEVDEGHLYFGWKRKDKKYKLIDS